MNRMTLLVLCTLGAAACGERPAQQEEMSAPAAGDPALNSPDVATTYAPALGVDLAQMTRTESGLHIHDLEVGTGNVAAAGDRVVVHYTGWLADGSRFDSSVGASPFEVVIGTGEVIRGWDEGIPGMRAGGRRRLVIPPALAYGAQGAGGVIPPGATLIFDVELLEVR
jgi:FKBP-type peptidyl-prolyl cis-trans isomerase FkpA